MEVKELVRLGVDRVHRGQLQDEVDLNELGIYDPATVELSEGPFVVVIA